MGILSGLLRGVGGYMVEDARARREAALEQLRQERLDQRQEIATRDSMKAAELNDERQLSTQLKVLGVTAENQQNLQELRINAEEADREDRQRHDVSLEDIRYQHRLTAESVAEARSAAREARRQGQVVTDYRVNDATHQLEGRNAYGEVITRTAADYQPRSSTSQRGSSRQRASTPAAPARPEVSRGQPAARRIRFDAQGRRIG